mmetsp:Transcript_1014/g.4285  ORF Transcript_1014/g.4285 Transcript_1014/m.4285 type:complete len:283 (+) Transcript_1014:408-1256(+)
MGVRSSRRPSASAAVAAAAYSSIASPYFPARRAWYALSQEIAPSSGLSERAFSSRRPHDARTAASPPATRAASRDVSRNRNALRGSLRSSASSRLAICRLAACTSPSLLSDRNTITRWHSMSSGSSAKPRRAFSAAPSKSHAASLAFARSDAAGAKPGWRAASSFMTSTAASYLDSTVIALAFPSNASMAASPPLSGERSTSSKTRTAAAARRRDVADRADVKTPEAVPVPVPGSSPASPSPRPVISIHPRSVFARTSPGARSSARRAVSLARPASGPPARW